MPIFSIQTPDGRTVDIEAADESTAMRGAQEWTTANPKDKPGVGKEIGQGFTTAMSGVPFFHDATALASAAVDPRTYTLGDGVGFEGARRDMRGQLRQETQDFTNRHPNIAGALTGATMGASMLVPGLGAAGTVATKAPAGANLGARLANTGMNAARGGTAAGTTGAVYAAGMDGTPQERLGNASTAAMLGAALGAPATAVAGRAAREPAAPNLAQLTAQKNAAYQAVDKMGASYTPQAMERMVADMRKEMTDARISRLRHPKAFDMLKEVEAVTKGKTPTLTELDQLRQVIRRDVASATDESERFFGQKMIANLDGFIGSAGTRDMATGSGIDASDAIRLARALNTRTAKVEAVTRATNKAELRTAAAGSGGNIDNAMRQNMARVLETQRNLTPDERAAVNAIVRGSPGQNVMRTVGKMSPAGGGLPLLASVLGAQAGGPAGAIPGVLGFGAKMVADARTKAKIADLVRLMANGGQRAARAESELAGLAGRTPEARQAYQQATAALLRGTGAAAATATSGP